LTVVQGLGYQQNLSGKKISTMAIRCRTDQLEDWLAFVPAVVDALEILQPGEIIRIE
jgi:hypothetical protein